MAATFWSRVMAGVRGFREGFLSADVADGEDFSQVDARQSRYALMWSYFENTAYRDIHVWAPQLRKDFALYQYIRNIYNPVYRIGDFWQTYLWGGPLDPDAGDGTARPTSLPIVTGNASLRPAIAQLWRWSNWQANKDILTLWGTVLGDVGLRVVDDVTRQKIYLERLHPGTLRDVTLDAFGNVKGYFLQEGRPHPEKLGLSVTYGEECRRDGADVVYRTTLNGELYAWNGQAAEWREPYGFVPLVVIQHRNVGLDWGWSEAHPALAKIREVDDLSSKLSDHIRKYVDPAWLFAGVNRPVDTPTFATPRVASALANNPEPERQEMKALYGPQGASATALVADLDIEGALKHINGILQELERDYPELRADLQTASGDASGRALRVARQRVERKVVQRRVGYDDALVRAQMMAVAIGGMRGYAPFGGFGLTSYAAGALEHVIGPRPVFAADTVDRLDEETALWKAAEQATKAGLPLNLFLLRNGWSEKQVAEYAGSPEYRARLASMEAASLGLESLRGSEGANAAPEDNQVSDAAA